MNTYRIELTTLPMWRDARGEGVIAQAADVCSIKLDKVLTRDVFTLVSDCSAAEAQKIAALLCNPVLQMWRTAGAQSDNFTALAGCDFLIAVGFRPGVTDNVSRTFRTAAADILGRKLREDEYVFSSTEYLISGAGLTAEQADIIGRKLLANELINSVTVIPGAQAADVCGIKLDRVLTRDVFTLVSDCSAAEAQKIAALLCNPVLQMWRTAGAQSDNFTALAGCDFLIAVGFRPGVTDNVSRTFRTAAADILGRKLREDEYVFSSTEYLISGAGLTAGQADTIGRKLLANELINSVTVIPGDQAENVPANLPFVKNTDAVEVRNYDLEVSDEKLVELSQKGILALSLEEMKAIQNYFRTAEGREAYGLSSNPTDVELEVLAQTWSEHCKHKIFSAEIDYEDTETGEKSHISSCYKSYIQKSTKEIATQVPWLVSVFKDNAGVINFNDKCDVAYKVETHNSPSALDPYGGAMTGIVGVNRDPLGTGQGAELLINVWGYCLGSPFTADENVPEGLLHPRRLRDGVHKGVIDGGNQSGIPYGNGWEYFDDRYIGKPLVYCGTVGKLPKSINGIPGSSKTSGLPM